MKRLLCTNMTMPYICHKAAFTKSSVFLPCQALPVPWCDMLTSTPVLALIACSVCSDFGFYTLLTELPTYLQQVLHFDLDSVSTDYRPE